MKKRKRAKNKQLTDTEIDQFCQSVEDVLTKIKDRTPPKKSKKPKKEDLSTFDKDILTYSH